MAVELRNRLFGQFGGKFDISPTAIFDYPTLGELAGHLASQLPPSEAPEVAEEVADVGGRETVELDCLRLVTAAAVRLGVAVRRGAERWVREHEVALRKCRKQLQRVPVVDGDVVVGVVRLHSDHGEVPASR